MSSLAVPFPADVLGTLVWALVQHCSAGAVLHPPLKAWLVFRGTAACRPYTPHRGLHNQHTSVQLAAVCRRVRWLGKLHCCVCDKLRGLGQFTWTGWVGPRLADGRPVPPPISSWGGTPCARRWQQVPVRPGPQ